MTDIWLNHLLAKGIALHAPGSPAEKRELLEILGLIEPGGSVVLPDDDADYSDLANVSDAKIVQRDDIRVSNARFKHLVPEGLRELPPEPVEKPGPQGGRPRKPESQIHGSHGGRRRHQQAGEPLCDECRAFAVTYQRERRAAKAAREAAAVEAAGGKKPPRVRKSCGTTTGATLHRRNGEITCDPCKVADNLANASRYTRRKLRDADLQAACGTEAGAKKHRALKESVCEACQAAVTKAKSEQARASRMAMPSFTPAKCGSESGFKRHKRAGEVPCDACRDAKNAVQRERKRAKRARERAAAELLGMATFSPAECGTESGHRRHRRNKEPICRPCQDAKNAAQRKRERAARERKKAEAQVIHVPGQLDIYEQEAS